MPLYSYTCKCGNAVENAFMTYENRNKYRCGKCNLTMQLQICTPSIHHFRGGMFEHIGPEPMHIETPEQLHKACEANDSYSPYLNDSPLGKKFRRKEI